jgi:type IV secretory pathway TrbL component
LIDKGVLKMGEEITNKAIGIGVSLLVIAIIIPLALRTLAEANVTGVDPTVITIMTVLLPILAIIGLALYFIPRRN